MVANQSPARSDLPPEMVAAAAVDAERQAQWVAQFLGALGEGALPKNRLTWQFLLHLGAALRLLQWEEQGFVFHRQVGLPEAHQAIRDAMGSLKAADPTGFCVKVLRLSIERFAWDGPRELGADMALDDWTEDTALDTLAEYLWATRNK